MRVQMQGSDRALARAMRAYLERRVRWTLGGYAGEVAQVTVRVLEDERAAGGAGGGCRVSAELAASGRLVEHEAGDGSLFTAIEAAVERMGRAVRRQVPQKTQQPLRR